MNFYFHLQFKRFWRAIRAFGVHPMLVVLILPPVVVYGLYTLITQFKYGIQVVFLIPIMIHVLMNTQRKYQFLKLHFDSKCQFVIRIIEQCVCCLPIIILLFYHQNLLLGLFFIFWIGIVSMLPTYNAGNTAIRTPFRAQSYELPMSFRMGLPLLLVSFALLIFSFATLTFQAGVVALLIACIALCLSFNIPDRIEYVRLFKGTANQFLLHKLKNLAIATIKITSLPLILFCVVFSNEWYWGLLACAVGYIIGGSAILIRYASFPEKSSFIYSIIFALSLTFPPFLIITTPFFYFKAYKNVQPYLIHDHQKS